MITTESTFRDAAISDDVSVLRDIHRESKSIAIYQRDIDQLQSELTKIGDESFECRASGTVKEITAHLKICLFDEYDALYEDVAELLRLFEEITQETSLRMLLATVTTNMCRKFHTDLNDLRLLCTYIGPGTLWLPDEAVSKEACKSNAENEDMVLDRNLIQQANPGDVLILKGALYPQPNPVLHRSPIIEERNEKRLLLRIDTNASLNLWT